jgi:hypothetical protein
MNYFLLLHKNKNYVSDDKYLLLQKADEIVSEYILEQMTQTGASYKYEKVVEEDEQDGLTFIVTSRNCNSLSFNQVEEVICQIVPVHFIESSKVDKNKEINDSHTIDNNTNSQCNTDEKYEDNNEEKSDIIEEESFEQIDNINNTPNTKETKYVETTDENNVEKNHSKEE